jgi:hypothetical protein
LQRRNPIKQTNKQTNTSSSFVFLKECNIVCIIGKSRRRRRKRSREREFQKAQKKIIHEAQRS